MDKAREFIGELRENWDDHYWWARHQALQAVLIAVAVGLVGLVFTYFEARIKLTHLKEAAAR